MTSVATGIDRNNCNTYFCVSETCAPKPSCSSSLPRHRTRTGTVTSIAVYKGLDSNSCPIWICNTTTSSRTTVQQEVKCGFPNPPCETETCPKLVKPSCPTGEKAVLYAGGKCNKYVCRTNEEIAQHSKAVSSTSQLDSSSGTSTTTTSCPSKPSCGSGKILKSNGINSAGCTSWTCVAQSCPSKPTCGSGKTLTITGTDQNGCTTYQCLGN